MKICITCGKEKEINEFHKHTRTKDGYRSECKDCCKKYEKEFHKKYPEKRILNTINQRCNNVNHDAYKYYGLKGIKNFLTLEDIKFLMKRDNYHNIDKPSIDRLNSNKNYTLDNCRFIEQGKNSAERNIRISSKAVLQFDLQGNFIKEFKSTMEIQRKLGIINSHISKCARGLKTCKKFIWKYKNSI